MILIALGANLPSCAGAPMETLQAALRELEHRGISVQEQSHFYRSPAWPDPSQPKFVNAMTRIETELPPAALLRLLHDVETQFGRQPGARNAPRTLDLDLIDYHGRVENGPPELPHPRLQDRLFVLAPLADVAPGWRHPVSGRSVEELIAALPADSIERVR